MHSVEIISESGKKIIQSGHGTRLADCLRDEGILNNIHCGGLGKCGKCKIRLLSGTVHDTDSGVHFIDDNYILACKCAVNSDIVIEVPSFAADEKRKTKIREIAYAVNENDLPVRKIYLELEPPSINDQLSDLERILAALPENSAFLPDLLSTLPSTLRKAGYKITCVLAGGKVIAIEAGDTTATNYGCIVDIGTTTVALYIVDMLEGRAIDAEGFANPQGICGSDVLSRAMAANTPAGRLKLQALILEGIGQAIKRICARKQIDCEQIYSLVVAGNTVMSHLFLGVEPDNLAKSPFIPCYRPAIDWQNSAFRLPMSKYGLIHVLANISGYVGSDTLGVALAIRLWEQDGICLAVDIGTNGEMLLGRGDRILACSVAAGPAFEGAHIEHGMRAGDGAIEKVVINGDSIAIKTIGDKPPKGICGSGLIDAASELLRAGIITGKGNFASGAEAPLACRLRAGKNGIREFVLAYAGEYGNSDDITLTQKDIRELQLAKAAIAAGIRILLKEAGLEAHDVEKCFLAGAFGNYLDIGNAVALGIFPGIDEGKIRAIGNAAAQGADFCLASARMRQIAARLAKTIRPIELSTHAAFNSLWIREMRFPAKNGEHPCR